MDRILRPLFAAALLACAFAAAPAQAQQKLPASHWHSGDESATEIWLVERGDGAIELHGRDAASSYGGLAIPGEKEGVWHITGTGFRFVGGLVFSYRSTLTLETGDGGPRLVEVWAATLPDGKAIESTTVLKPVAK